MFCLKVRAAKLSLDKPTENQFYSNYWWTLQVLERHYLKSWFHLAGVYRFYKFSGAWKFRCLTSDKKAGESWSYSMLYVCSNGSATSEDLFWKLDALQVFVMDLHWPEPEFARHLEQRLKLMASDMMEACVKRSRLMFQTFAFIFKCTSLHFNWL